MTAAAPLLVATDATVAFGAVMALDHVSVSIPPGSICGLIGPNGSGKTTLLGTISRLVPLSAGHIVFNGVEMTARPAHVVSGAGIARTFQAIRLLSHLTVRENVMVGATCHLGNRSLLRSWLDIRQSRASERAARSVADEALQRVGMSEHGDAAPSELPYGMQRRVEIARALATKPKLLLLDEPVAGMNHAERHEIGTLMRSLQGEGLTQILVEHDLATIHRVCDVAYVLNFGQVIAHGLPRGVADIPAVREAYLGHASLDDDCTKSESGLRDEVGDGAAARRS